LVLGGRLGAAGGDVVASDYSATVRRSFASWALSIVDHLVEEMDGVVEVETEDGKGTRFTVRLPPHRTKEGP
jgi:sensor histidine kinase regulating citrate/malate metabolism